MSWKQAEKPRTVLATPALVKEFVEMEPVPHDRPLSEKRLQVYERILRAGDFRTVTWASVACHETNCTYRVNGKHTATLLSKLDKLPEFHVTVERYGAEDLKDVANLYNTFDSSLASRTSGDINMAFAATIGELRGLAPRLVNLAVSAIAANRWDENELRKVPPAERAEQLVDHTDFVVWLNKLIPSAGPGGGVNSTTAHIRRAPVAAAMFATYQRAPRLADQFWLAVKEESAPDRDDSTRTLARFLIRARIGGGRGGAKMADTKTVTNRELYAKCVHAWNAWRKGEQLTRFNYFANSPLPVPSK